MALPRDCGDPLKLTRIRNSKSKEAAVLGTIASIFAVVIFLFWVIVALVKAARD